MRSPLSESWFKGTNMVLLFGVCCSCDSCFTFSRFFLLLPKCSRRNFMKPGGEIEFGKRSIRLDFWDRSGSNCGTRKEGFFSIFNQQVFINTHDPCNALWGIKCKEQNMWTAVPWRKYALSECLLVSNGSVLMRVQNQKKKKCQVNGQFRATVKYTTSLPLWCWCLFSPFSTFNDGMLYMTQAVS